MKMLQWIIKASFLLATSSLYAGGNGETHLSDLMRPAINFLILAGFLVFKLRNPVKEMFDKNALLVKETYDFAEGKNKEAEIKLKMYKENFRTLMLKKEKRKVMEKKRLRLSEKKELRKLKGY